MYKSIKICKYQYIKKCTDIYIFFLILNIFNIYVLLIFYEKTKMIESKALKGGFFIVRNRRNRYLISKILTSDFTTKDLYNFGFYVKVILNVCNFIDV